MIPILAAEIPNIFIAFFAGVVSFLSPCVLPLVPAYLAYISGRSAQSADVLLQGSGPLTAADLQRTQSPQLMASTTAGTMTVERVNVAGGATAPRAMNPRLYTFIHALFFVLGFSFIFALLGVSANILGGVLFEHRQTVQQISGIILIIFGIHTLGLINIPFLNFERQLDVRANPRFGYFSSMLIGMGFAAGWIPCVGVTLGAIFTLAFNETTALSAAFLFFVFSLGLGVPFLIFALGIGSISRFLQRVTSRGLTWRIGNWTVIRNLNIISFISGVFLILMGWAIFSGSLGFFAQFLPTWSINV